jgi:hypothetical protein|nr:MAG TPA: hypothetical protein [Caudoviricetes sp.]DAJ52610.1 MAG TPA: hypothetical protein [Caudoviricetes sp.]
MNSELDQYFKEQIDEKDSFDVMVDENAFLNSLITKRDIVDAIENGDDDDEIMDDDEIALSTLSDEDLDELVGDEEDFIDTAID